jgi:hypothetical protein
MNDDTSAPKFESLLTPRLLNSTPLLQTGEKEKWSIIAETVEVMYKLFYRTPLNAFGRAGGEMYETDLGLMMEAIDLSPSDSSEYEGYGEVIRLLGKSRSLASNVARYFDSSPAEHQAATDAMMLLQETLREAFEYIKAISEKLDLGPDITDQMNAN